MTIPNLISMVRLLLIPVFVMLVMYYVTGYSEAYHPDRLRWWATAVFIVAAVSDGIDGYIARRFNQRSELGAVLDPLADKILLVTALVLLSWNFQNAFHPIPLWLTILIISRDVFVSGGYIVMRMFAGHRPEVKPHWSGKAGTALTMIVIVLVLLKKNDPPYFLPLVIATGACVVISLLIYLRRGLMQLHRAETA
ncbi:MAG: CDP-alcohol phosphatidyltransferase family protein [Verrucomicrobiae bacterium]|nr:CDP-alcohol phosphatidyltransferase family protein [Verrucomicrobiae bacterium]